MRANRYSQWLFLADEPVPAGIAKRLLGHRQRNEYPRTLQCGDSREAWRCDTDDRHGSAVDDERAVHDAGVGTEARTPEVVAQDDHRMPARNAIVLRTEQAADRRRDTEGGEVVPGDEKPAGFRAPALVRDICTKARVRGQLEAVVFELLEIAEQRVTEDRVDAPAEIAPSIANRGVGQAR